ncbi:uncharacterized protein LOC128993024 [Macrosteles quadrilineatus]|uniref:uncharacterized protein LOC128993024 n=1 Tax=Macrosteles quadrilineatus TaxID=74068 RepID=UPI0023E16C5E|nr:uncharacterized protein LOC128993024 [Macrosteles quadrilineatus]
METNENGELECAWPDNTISVRKAMVTNKPPNASWEKWRIRVLTSCDELPTALLKERQAQSTSDLGSCAESDAGRGRRIKKPSMRLFSDSSSGEDSDLPPPKLPKPRPIQNQINYTTPKAQTSSNMKDRSEGTSSLYVASETPSTSHNEGGMERMEHQIKKMEDRMESMERTVRLMRMEVREVRDFVAQIAKAAPHSLTAVDNTTKINFNSKFPINTLEEFIELEESLKNEETNNLMIDFFTRVGGSSVEDSVRRTLVRLLSNEVAVSFSWEGRKGKRALNNLAIIKALERVVAASHPQTFTIKIFEVRVREWFRQAGTRVSNKTKRALSQ